jgi:release factor glutamine methyltransferase
VPSSAPTIAEALLEASRTIDRNDAVYLLCFALKRQRAFLIAHSEQPLTRVEYQSYKTLYGARALGVPVAYLIGEREFYGRRFFCDKRALIPRPETELIVDLVLQRFDDRPRRVLDLGTGTGILAVTLKAERPDWSVTAVDLNPDTLELARKNAASLLGTEQSVQWLISDWFSAVPMDRPFDIIVSNPPYIELGDSHLDEGDLRFEPAMALVSGKSGLDAIRAIADRTMNHLTVGGVIMIEHGFTQGAVVRQLLTVQGFADVQTHKDLASHERVTLATKTASKATTEAKLVTGL